MGIRTLRNRKVGSSQHIDIGQYSIPCVITGISKSGSSKSPTRIYEVRIVEGSIHKTSVRKVESRISVPGVKGAVKAINFTIVSRKVRSLPKQLLDKWKPGSLVTVEEDAFNDLDADFSFELGRFD